MIKLICIGKIKEKYLQEAINDYKLRLGRYVNLKIIELDNINNKNIDLIKEQEGINILKYIKEKDFVVTLQIDGQFLSSEQLADKINNIFNSYANITFVIGGSYGISDALKKRSNYQISFSKLTFPHQLFRVMLLEQIYRSYKINNNESYHK